MVNYEGPHARVCFGARARVLTMCRFVRDARETLKTEVLRSFVADPRLTKQRIVTMKLSRYLRASLPSPFDALIMSQAAYHCSLSALMAFATPLKA